MFSEKATFGIIDYCVFAVVLAVSMGIGIYTSLRGNKSPEQFLMGNRSFGAIPVSMSLLTSFVSAISLLGFSGEVYAYGTQMVLFIVGTVLGMGAAATFILPVLYPLKLTSVNEYLELRFNSPLLRKTITVISCLNGLLYMGICLYAPTIALASVTTLSSKTYIYILGIVVTIYSSIGGIRAVIWTDVFQLTVMLIGLFSIVFIGIYEVGGPKTIWEVSYENGRLDIFNMSLNPHVRHTFFNTIFFGFFMNAAFYGISQINVQRLCSVATFNEAKKILWITLVGMVLVYLLIFIGGLVGFAAYADCDPWMRGLISKKEEIIPYYIVDRLYFITGLPGLFVATITGGALSSLSSVMNALVAMIWKDCCSELKIMKNFNPKVLAVIPKLFSFLIGAIIIGIAVLASHATNIIQFSNTITSACYAPIFGVFLLGFLFPRTNIKGVWIGFCTSTAFGIWMNSGAFFYKKAPVHLPFSTAGCPSDIWNSTEFSQINVYTTFNINATSASQPEEDNYDFPLMKLYNVSYAWFSTIGTLNCILIALFVSAVTGNEDLKNVSPMHVTPLVRKLYWGERVATASDKEKEVVSL